MRRAIGGKLADHSERLVKCQQHPVPEDLYASRVEQLHERAEVMTIVVKGASAHEIAVDHARLVHVNAAAHFEVKLALPHRGHAPPFHAARPSWDFHAMT